jgi:sarcosine oxidase delta subunit
MELYNTCKNFYESVDYVITLDQVSEILAGNANYLVDPFNALQNGDVVLVVEGNIDVSDPGPYSAAFSRAFNLGSDASIVNAAFTVGGVGTNITLTPKSVYSADDYVIVLRGESRGEIWCFDGTEWSLGQTKSERGQHPLFKLYDDEKTDLETYPDTDFAGEKVFGYEFNPTGAFDRVLGFAPAFTNQGSFANYRFEWTLNNTRYRQNIVDENDEEIRGYYFWRDWVRDDYYNGWSNIRGAQRVPVIQTTVSDGVTPVEFELGTTGYGHPTEFTVSLVDGKYRWHSHSYMDLVSVGYENPEFIWKYDTEYTINDLISESANKLEFVPIRSAALPTSTSL